MLATSRVPLRLSGGALVTIRCHLLPVPGCRSQHRFEELVANEGGPALRRDRARAVDPSFNADRRESRQRGHRLSAPRRPATGPRARRRLDQGPVAGRDRSSGSSRALESSSSKGLATCPRGSRRCVRRSTGASTCSTSAVNASLGELSVFAGGWTIEDAEAVIGDDVVARACRTRRPQPRAPAGRSLHRARDDSRVRRRAVERIRLGTRRPCRRRHAERFVAVQAERCLHRDPRRAGKPRTNRVLCRARCGGGEPAGCAGVDGRNLECRARSTARGRPSVVLARPWSPGGRDPACSSARPRRPKGQPALHAAALASVGPFNTRRGEYRRATEQLQTARRLFAEPGQLG